MIRIVLLTLFVYTFLFAQEQEQHVWKVVNAADGSKFWYDASALDTINGDRFNVWILETHQPPVKYEGIDGEVFRSKTLYAINLTTVKYGILKIRYYDSVNKEIFKFDYDNPPPPESIRYTYPITDNSLLFYLIEELYGPKGVKSGKMN
ncbi:MAG: hypothetical protein P8X47_02475 [Ignavibacteriaceae bacterium]